MSQAEQPFYVTGGTLRHDAACYVERQADKDLLEGLRQGQFCYVLTSRQMGKSSLMVRTANRLRAEGIRAIALDLTAIGQNLTPEQWYEGLMARMGRQLGMEDELEDWWLANERLGPCQRLFTALRELALPRHAGSIVVFVDEIDTVRSLPFSTDEFFAAVRECYNRRAEDAEFRRLTFCLLGVATPSDLIRDTRTTPFNIGRRIELSDFAPAEAAGLTAGLGRAPALATTLLERILYWTNGHPYLTQRLCQAIAEDPGLGGPRAVDRLCEDLFLSHRARERDDNLLFVRERILRSEAGRADLLTLYEQVRSRRKSVRDEEANSLVAILRLSGIVRVVEGYLWVRNRIYFRVFDRDWVQANMPDAEVRRQRAAFRRGVIRTAAVATVLVVAFAGLAFYALNESQKARYQAEQASEANRLTKIANTLSQQRAAQLAETLSVLEQQKINEIFAADDVPKALAYLARVLRQNPANDRAAFRLLSVLTQRKLARPAALRKFDGQVLGVAFAKQGPLVLTAADRRLRLWDVRQEAPLAGPWRTAVPVAWGRFSPSGAQFLLSLTNGVLEVYATAEPTKPRWRLAHPRTPQGPVWSADETRLVTVIPMDPGNYRARAVQAWDVSTGQALTPSVGVETAGYGLNVSFEGSNQVRLASYGPPPSTRNLDLATGVLGPETPQDPTRPIPMRTDQTQARPELVQIDTPGNWRIITRGTWTDAQTMLPSHDLDGTLGLHDVSLDGREALTVHQDGQVCLWAVPTSGLLPLAIHTGPESSPPSVELASDGRRLLTLTADGVCSLWDTQTGKALAEPLGETGRVAIARFSYDGQQVVTGSGDGWLRLFEAQTGRAVAPPFRRSPTAATPNADAPAAHLEFSQDGQRLLAAFTDGAVEIWSPRVGRQEARIQAQAGTPTPAHFDPEGQRLAPHFSPDGELFVASNPAHAVRVWEARTGRAIGPAISHPAAVRLAQFSPDGRKLATASKGTAQVWEPRTGQALTPALTCDADVKFLLFTPDGQFIVTAAGDRAVRVWQAGNGGMLHAIKQQEDVLGISLSRDGRLLAIAAYDQVGLWDVRTGTPLAEPLKSGSLRLASLSLSANGQYVAAGASSVAARVWELPRLEGPVPAWLPLLTEALVAQRLTDQGISEPVDLAEFQRLSKTIQESRAEDAYTRWAKWFLEGPRPGRTISPFAQITLREHVRRCLDSRNAESIEVLTAAVQLRGVALEAYAQQARRNQGTGMGEALRNSASEAQALAQSLLRQLPDNADAWRLAGLARHTLGQPEQALEALSHVRAEQERPPHARLKGEILEKLGRTNDALAAFSHAIDLARTHSPASVSDELLIRGEFLQRQNRLPEAARDVALARGIPPRDPATPKRLLDLSLAYSGALTNIHHLGAGTDVFRELPVGVHRLADTEFDLRGIVARSDIHMFGGGRESMVSIPVGLRASRLHFLHGSAFGRPPGITLGRYRVHYANRQTQDIPIVYGQTVRDWFCTVEEGVEAALAPVAWVGTCERNEASQGFNCLYDHTWTNPSPDLEIQRLEFEPMPAGAVPFLLAVTAEEANDRASTGSAAGGEQPAGANPSEAVRRSLPVIDQGLERHPQTAGLWEAKAALLERAQQPGAALQSYARAIALAEQATNRPNSVLSRTLAGRLKLLARLGRTAEAQAEAARAHGIPARDPKAKPNLIDLTAYYNAGLSEDWHGGSGGNDLSPLPAGVQTFGGIEFDVRGIVQLAGQSLEGYPASVTGIKVGRSARRLHFLHANGWSEAAGTEIGTYVLHYANGEEKTVPIIYGQDVRDWWTAAAASAGGRTPTVAWSGANSASAPSGAKVSVFHSAPDNPLPDEVIESIDFVSKLTQAAPFLIAITLE
jgi:WD40 repeat protein